MKQYIEVRFCKRYQSYTGGPYVEETYVPEGKTYIYYTCRPVGPFLEKNYWIKTANGYKYASPVQIIRVFDKLPLDKEGIEIKELGSIVGVLSKEEYFAKYPPTTVVKCETPNRTLTDLIKGYEKEMEDMPIENTPLQEENPNKLSTKFIGPRVTNVWVNEDKETIVLKWSDNDKTIVKCCEEDEFDLERGLAFALIKKIYGTSFRKFVKKVQKDIDAEKAKKAEEDKEKKRERALIAESIDGKKIRFVNEKEESTPAQKLKDSNVDVYEKLLKGLLGELEDMLGVQYTSVEDILKDLK